MPRCSKPVFPLLEQTRQICETNKQFARIAGLLVAYVDVFSRGENNVGRANVVEHLISLTDSTKLIKQPTRCHEAETKTYPVLHIDDSLEAISSNVFFSTLNLVNSYLQVQLNRNAMENSNSVR